MNTAREPGTYYTNSCQEQLAQDLVSLGITYVINSHQNNFVKVWGTAQLLLLLSVLLLSVLLLSVLPPAAASAGLQASRV